MAVRGLGKYNIAEDLPFISEIALWAVRTGNTQASEAALWAFRERPDKQNLPAIEAVWQAYSRNLDMTVTVSLAVEKHLFPESVPLLTQLLGDELWKQNARKLLRDIVGKDLGGEPQAWLDWYKAQKGKEEK